MMRVRVGSLLSVLVAIVPSGFAADPTPEDVVKKLKEVAAEDIKHDTVKFNGKIKIGTNKQNYLTWAIPDLNSLGGGSAAVIYTLEAVRKYSPDKAVTEELNKQAPAIEKTVADFIRVERLKGGKLASADYEKFNGTVKKIYHDVMAAAAKQKKLKGAVGGFPDHRFSELQLFTVTVRTSSKKGTVYATPLLSYRKAKAENRTPELTAYAQGSVAKMGGVYWYEVQKTPKARTSGRVSPEIAKGGDFIFAD
jgi:hypothetical protein